MLVRRRVLSILLFGTLTMGCGSDESSSEPAGTGGSSGSGGAGGGGGSGSSSGAGGSGGSGATGGGAGAGGATTACSTETNTAGGPDPWGGCWPGGNNTGIPVGTTLTPYGGPCTVTVDGTEIDEQTVTCDPLLIEAANVKITRSKIEGSVLVDAPGSGSFEISDSEVDAGPIAPGDTDDNSGIGKSNFTATRVDVHGGKRGIWCENDCTVTDCWIHDQSPDPSGVAHESGMRMGAHATISHNSILCNAPDFPPDAGCSADLTGYGDFAPIEHNTIHRNLLLATTGGACAYGGSSGDDGSKPFGDQANNIVFEENVFQHGPEGKCGSYFPITDFDETRPGNQWLNNVWDDGTALPPAN